MIPILLVTLLVFIATPNVVHAQEFLQGVMWAAITGILGTFLSLAGWLFDIAINSYVIGFADEYITSGIGLAIDQGWALVRDVMNMLFIFGLLYIGVKLILNSDDSKTRSLLVNLIIAALLVNFSLFISKGVVDVSNGLASQIALSGFVQGEPITNQLGEERYQVDMAEDLMSRLGLTSVFAIDSDPRANQLRNEWGYIFGTALLLIVTTFVFAAGAIMLIIRAVALNFFILFSPLMFIGWAFPPLARLTTYYWRAFLGRAFFAPFYLLFLYFSVSIITALRTNRGLSQFASDTMGNAMRTPYSQTPNLDAASAFPYFVFAIISLIASLVIAQKLGADGANQSIKVGQDMRRWAQNNVKRGAGAATLGTTAWLGQKSLGKAADSAVNSRAFKRFADNSKFGEFTYKKAQGVADSSFDVRRVGGVGKKLGIGEKGKGGYKTRKENAEKEAAAFHKALKIDLDSKGGQKRKAEIEDEIKKERDVIEGNRKYSGLARDKLEKDVKGLTSSINYMTKRLQEGIKNGTMTTSEIKRDEEKIAERTQERDEKQAVLEYKVERDDLLDQAAEAHLKEAETDDPKEATAYRQKIENIDKKLDELKDFEEREANLGEYGVRRDEQGNLDASRADVKHIVESEAQAGYERRLANESAPAFDTSTRLGKLANETDRFFESFSSFSADKLAAIQQKTKTGDVLKPNAEILRQVMKEMGPTATQKINKADLREAFAKALEDNRYKVAKQIGKSAATAKERQEKALDIKNAMEESGASFGTPAPSPTPTPPKPSSGGSTTP